MRADAPILDAVVLDSNQLGDPPQRRLNMSMMDNGARHIDILESLKDEAERCIKSSEMRRWERSFSERPWRKEGKTMPMYLQLEIIAEVGEAAIAWFRRELTLPDGLLRCPVLTREQFMQAGRLRRSMPDDLFVGANGPNKDTDRSMVAEAAVTGRRLLISDDESAIRQLRLNKWLHEHRWTKETDLVMTIDRAHASMEETIDERALYEWALGAFLPEQPAGNDISTIRLNAEQLEYAGMKHAAKRVRQELLADPSPVDTFARIRQALPERARATEARRLHSVRQAADCVFQGWSP